MRDQIMTCSAIFSQSIQIVLSGHTLSMQMKSQIRTEKKTPIRSLPVHRSSRDIFLQNSKMLHRQTEYLKHHALQHRPFHLRAQHQDKDGYRQPSPHTAGYTPQRALQTTLVFREMMSLFYSLLISQWLLCF